MEDTPKDEPSESEPTNRKWDWAAIKDRLAIFAVIAAILILLFMQIDLAVINFNCSFIDFIMFKCNRWSFG